MAVAIIQPTPSLCHGLQKYVYQCTNYFHISIRRSAILSRQFWSDWLAQIIQSISAHQNANKCTQEHNNVTQIKHVRHMLNKIHAILIKNVIVTFRVSRRRREVYIGHAHLCVCCVSVCLSVSLSVTAFPHYCTDPGVTWGMVGSAL